ncbi:MULTISPECIES: phosphodiesterase [Roseomonadaceae]|uniref:Phosphodiesterase n=1 Tax=Falsiroseomonas oleicola TaxID=2801474 RepID=A0ABS6H9Y5_9PROT|nr:phosphodiesterase [Roseomonas oleicola]MBU8544135.1 phosphodiesterase [Roseomonas oleicola]
MKFIHLSDLHLVGSGATLHGLDPRDRLRRCVAHIRRFHADAAFVVLTGDLTHGGEPGGYAAARAILAEMPMPLHVTIGNHDSRAAFRAAFPHVPVSECGFVQDAFDTPEGRFILLDTHEPQQAEGRLCAQRLAWLERALRTSSGPVFLGLHHPPFRVGLGRMDRIRLRDGESLLGVLRPHLGRVRHMFVGHLHRALAGSWHGVPFSGVRGTNHQIALDFVTQDVAPVSFEAPGYGVVLVSPEAVVAHLEELPDGESR